MGVCLPETRLTNPANALFTAIHWVPPVSHFVVKVPSGSSSSQVCYRWAYSLWEQA